MPEQQLTPHQRDRARFAVAAERAGKLDCADEQIRDEVRAFIAAYPRERIVRKIAGDSAPDCVDERTVARARDRRTRSTRATRAGPDDDDPHLERACEECGGSLAGKRRHAKTCDERCKKARQRRLRPFRVRYEQATEALDQRRVPASHRVWLFAEVLDPEHEWLDALALFPPQDACIREAV
jgi:hypothetical protein